MSRHMQKINYHYKLKSYGNRIMMFNLIIFLRFFTDSICILKFALFVKKNKRKRTYNYLLL